MNPVIKKLSTMGEAGVRGHAAFSALHALYHERDFRVRVNDACVQMARDALRIALGREDEQSAGCPACRAGFSQDDIWSILVDVE